MNADRDTFARMNYSRFALRPPPIKYLNTDLDLTSADDLRPLVRALERRGMFALHVRHEEGGWRASLEAVGKEWRTPAGHIRDILKAVDALSPRSRGAWDRCRTREANIGYESGLRPRLGQLSGG
jgi:hypothetical protein